MPPASLLARRQASGRSSAVATENYAPVCTALAATWHSLALRSAAMMEARFEDVAPCSR